MNSATRIRIATSRAEALRHPLGDCIGDPLLALKLAGISGIAPSGRRRSPPSRVPPDRYSWRPAVVTGKEARLVDHPGESGWAAPTASRTVTSRPASRSASKNGAGSTTCSANQTPGRWIVPSTRSRISSAAASAVASA